MDKKEVLFGPAGLGPVKTAEKVLEEYHKLGLRACEIAFTYGPYIKESECEKIKEVAKRFKIRLSIHAHYWINLSSEEEIKIEQSKKRILDCCRIGEMLGAEVVVFHPGFYGKEKDKEKTYQTIKKGVIEILEEIKRKGWKIEIAPETTGKVNVFGSIEEISRLAKETGCSFCIDFAHILAREKIVDYKKVERLFPQDKWHIHFSGIVYGEKGERSHRKTEKDEWKTLLKNLPKDKKMTIINESPDMINDSKSGIVIFENI